MSVNTYNKLEKYCLTLMVDILYLLLLLNIKIWQAVLEICHFNFKVIKICYTYEYFPQNKVFVLRTNSSFITACECSINLTLVRQSHDWSNGSSLYYYTTSNIGPAYFGTNTI